MNVTYIIFNHGLYAHGNMAWKKIKKRDDRPHQNDRHYMETGGLWVVVRHVGHDHKTGEWFAYCESLKHIECPEKHEENEHWLIKDGWAKVKLEPKHLEGLAH
jgi:hypothetical protein